MTENNDQKKHGGPKTPEGRRRSSLNSMRHGFTASTLVLPLEDRAKFEELLDDYIGEYEPATKLELDLVHELAILRWRLQRIWVTEAGMIAITCNRNSRQTEAEWKNPNEMMRVTLGIMELAEKSNGFALLSRYETRLNRRFHQVLAEIEHLQDKRKSQALVDETNPNDTQVTQSPTNPESFKVVLTIPKAIVRNELHQPIVLTPRDEKTPPPASNPPDKLPSKEDDAA